MTNLLLKMPTWMPSMMNLLVRCFIECKHVWTVFVIFPWAYSYLYIWVRQLCWIYVDIFVWDIFMWWTYLFETYLCDGHICLRHITYLCDRHICLRHIYVIDIFVWDIFMWKYLFETYLCDGNNCLRHIYVMDIFLPWAVTTVCGGHTETNNVSFQPKSPTCILKWLEK
jgi:hypothetical protein